MKKIITIISILISIPLFSQEHRPEIHCKHFLYGYPYGTSETNDLIIRDIYALSNNDSTKFADWVAYRLTMHEVDGDLTVERKWKADPWLDSNETLMPKPNAYKNANKKLKTDRGHQAPLASFKGSKHASHTNYLSNITPQKSALNQGPWVHLENKIREVVKDGNTTYVMTGPLYERDMPKLPKSDMPHTVPSGYWKIISVENSEGIHVSAFIFDQDTPRADKVMDHQVTIDEVELRSGLDFFGMLEDSLEDDLEETKHTGFTNQYFKD